MKDRGMIKWMPFNSVISNKSMMTSILKEKEKIKKPEISDSDVDILEDQIIDAYYSQINITITYYKNGYLLKVNGKIEKIDQVYKLIYLDNGKKLLFKQIIEIKLG